MASSTRTTAAANWYPDPVDPSYERYWDGSDWTDYVRPVDRPVRKPTIASPDLRDRTGGGERDGERARNPFSTAALVLGALAVLVLPLILGPIGLVSAIIGKVKGEPNATAAMVAVGIATVVGLMLGALIDIGAV